jgi:hypothetical protein
MGSANPMLVCRTLRAITTAKTTQLLPVVLNLEVVDRHLSQQKIMTSIEHIDYC